MKLTLFLLLTAFAGSLHADVKLPAVFADHMVLQRNKPVSVWGWADAGEEVMVNFAGQSKKTTTAADGSWKISLDALTASSEPAELKVKGKNEIVLKDVLVGEVWICSGQSNMQWSVKSADNSAKEIADANHPLIRLFAVKNHVSDVPNKDFKEGTSYTWTATTPDSIPSFSAVGYFFGRELQKALNVPVGLINTSWGGTRAEAWTSKPALEAVPTTKAIITGWDEVLKTYDAAKAKADYDAKNKPALEKIAKIKAENAKPGAVQQPVPPAPRGFENLGTSQHRPAVLFNAMISPLVPFGVRGAIWYQGESNQGRAEQYLTLLPTMIKDWRTQWKDEFSFYIVQLAGFGNGKPQPQSVGAPDTWAELQWTQMQTAINLSKCGLVVTNDIGTEKDIHPTNKQEVGRRLALQALAKDYQKKDIVSGGPFFSGGTKMGNKFAISFTNVGGGLQTRDGGELKGFIIAGADKVWKPASAKIVGQQVHVWAEGLTDPAAVRYAWASWSPEANLINKEGLPATLFRTDKWDLSTKGAENPFGNAKPAAPAPAPAATPAPAAKPAEPLKKAA